MLGGLTSRRVRVAKVDLRIEVGTLEQPSLRVWVLLLPDATFSQSVLADCDQKDQHWHQERSARPYRWHKGDEHALVVVVDLVLPRGPSNRP